MEWRKWVEMVEWRAGLEGLCFLCFVLEAEEDFNRRGGIVNSILPTRRIGYVSLFGPSLLCID